MYPLYLSYLSLQGELWFSFSWLPHQCVLGWANPKGGRRAGGHPRVWTSPRFQSLKICGGQKENPWKPEFLVYFYLFFLFSIRIFGWPICFSRTACDFFSPLLHPGWVGCAAVNPLASEVFPEAYGPEDPYNCSRPEELLPKPGSTLCDGRTPRSWWAKIACLAKQRSMSLALFFFSYEFGQWLSGDHRFLHVFCYSSPLNGFLVWGHRAVIL